MYNTSESISKKSEYYKKFPRNGDCQFCNFPSEQIIWQSDSFLIVRNKFSYEVFDMCAVEDHLMLIPKKHTDNLSALLSAERVEFIDILTDYESKEYNVYFREPKSSVKSVDHHHTHLLKLGDRINSLKYTKEPYRMQYN